MLSPSANHLSRASPIANRPIRHLHSTGLRQQQHNRLKMASSSSSAHARTHIDYIRVRAQGSTGDIKEALATIYPHTTPEHYQPVREIGGYAEALSLKCPRTGEQLARIDIGGSHTNGWHRIDIGGYGCSQARSHITFLQLQDLNNAEITRIDLAYDTYNGSINTDHLIKAYGDGYFTTHRRAPNRGLITSQYNGQDYQTITIGSRNSHKYLRGYYKAIQQASIGRHSIITAGGDTDIANYYRIEVEYKADSTHSINWDVIVNTDAYFAGAYPFTAAVIDYAGDTKQPVYNTKERQMADAQQAIAHIKTSLVNTYGKHIAAIIAAEGVNGLLSLVAQKSPDPKLMRAYEQANQSTTEQANA